MSQPENENQTTGTTFGSLSELQKFSETKSVTLDDQSQATLDNEVENLVNSIVNEPQNPDLTLEGPTGEVLSVNSVNSNTPTPVLEPTVKVVENPVSQNTVEPKDTKTKDISTDTSTPDLEVQLAKDSVEDKAAGNIIETKNETLSVMREIAKAAAESSVQIKRVREVLENAVIDPNNIEIATDDGSDPIAVHEQMKLLEIARPNPVFPVIALKSGYKVDMAALNNNDKVEIRNINGSPFDNSNKLLSIIHRKINNTSVGRINYKRFLQITAEEDYETLLYGIFHSTFPEAIEYSVRCPHCQTDNSLKLHPNHLVEVIDRDRAGRYVAQVLEGYGRGEEFLKESLVAKTKRIVLPESKFVLELKTPTLEDMLKNLKQIEKLKSYHPEFVIFLKFISNLFVPDVQALAQGYHRFIPVNDVTDRLNNLVKLSDADMRYLRKEFSERVSTYAINYQIPTFNFANATCAKEIKEVKVDLTNLLFFALSGAV